MTRTAAIVAVCLVFHSLAGSLVVIVGLVLDRCAKATAAWVYQSREVSNVDRGSAD